jgi:hypothetical protein
VGRCRGPVSSERESGGFLIGLDEGRARKGNSVLGAFSERRE